MCTDRFALNEVASDYWHFQALCLRFDGLSISFCLPGGYPPTRIHCHLAVKTEKSYFLEWGFCFIRILFIYS